jgi:hypothetical protein
MIVGFSLYAVSVRNRAYYLVMSCVSNEMIKTACIHGPALLVGVLVIILLAFLILVLISSYIIN